MEVSPVDGNKNCPTTLAGEATETRGREAVNSQDDWKLELEYFADGDAIAFWRLWETHQKYLYSICLKQMGGVREEAEDALSRVMIKVWEALPCYGSKIKNLRAWLTRVTHNLCIDIHREKSRRRNVKSLDEITMEDNRELSCTLESPEEAALRQEIWDYLNHIINELSPKLRLPFMLHFFYDMRYSDIATQLRITPENARKRGQLARDLLRQKMNNYISGFVPPASTKEPRKDS